MGAKNNKKFGKLNALESISQKDSNIEKGSKKEWTVRSVDEYIRAYKGELMFSFKFLDRQHQSFNLGGLSHVCENWFVELMECFKEVSKRTWGQLIQIPTYRAHGHNFKKTNYAYEIFGEQALEQLECVQFALSKSKGRVHGFLIDNCFYIYWLDPHHNMNDSDGYESDKKFPSTPSCFELLNQHNVDLMEENEKLRKEIESLYNWIDEQTS